MSQTTERLCCPECLAEVRLSRVSIQRNELTACTSCRQTFEARHALPAESGDDAEPPWHSGSRLAEPTTQSGGAAVKKGGTVTRRLRLHQVSQSAWEKLLSRLEALAPAVRRQPVLWSTVLLAVCLSLAVLGTTLANHFFLLLHALTLTVFLLVAVTLREDIYGPVNLILLGAFVLLGLFRLGYAYRFFEYDAALYFLFPLTIGGGHLFFIQAEDLDHL